MADEVKQVTTNYENLDRPYNDYMQRSQTPEIPTSADTGNENIDMLKPVKTGQALDNIVLDTFIRSTNYSPKTQGFYIDGRNGSMECMKLYVGGGGIVGGSLDVPDITSNNSFHVDALGNTWWGSNVLSGISGSKAAITSAGAATFKNITIDGSGSGYASFISDTLDTSSKKILSDFDFGDIDYAGAVKAGDITWDTVTGAITGGSGIAVYRNGIVGSNNGIETFSIDATTGAATFAGTLMAPNGTLGQITAGDIQGATLNIPNSTSPLFSVNANGDVVANSLRRNDFHLFTLFESIDGYYKNWIGGGSITLEQGPYISIKTGTSANDWTKFMITPTYTGDISFTWSKKRSFHTAVSFVSNPATSQVIIVGMGENDTNTTNKVSFWASGNTLYAATANGSNYTLTDTGISINPSVTYDLKAIFYPGLRAEFFVDGVLKTSINTTLPSSGSASSILFNVYAKTITTAQREVRFSFYDFWQESF